MVIPPKAIILTKAIRAAVSMMAKVHVVAASEVFLISTASEVFLIFTTHIYSLLFRLKCTIVNGYYCVNTPSMQNFILLTSGG